jgi:hypothetical protein
MQKISKLTLTVLLALLPVSIVMAQESNQRLEKALKQGEETLKNTDPKDVEAFMAKSFEARAFVVYLGCLKAIPLPVSDDITSWDIVNWPLRYALTIKYPLVLAVQINLKDQSKGRPFIVVKQQSSDSPWEMTEGRIESKGETIKNIPLPSAQMQRKANTELPRLMQAWKTDAANKTLQPTDCAGG